MKLRLAENHLFDVILLQTQRPLQFSQDYSLELVIANPQQVALDEYLNHAVHVDYEDGMFHGVITGWQHQRGVVAQPIEHVEVSSPLALLRQQKRERVYPKCNLQRLVTQVLATAGVEVRLDWHCQASFEPEYFIQYQQTDFEFLQACLSLRGIYWYIDHQAPSLIVTDTWLEQQRHYLAYRRQHYLLADKNTVTNVVKQQQLLAENVMVADSNWLQPEKTFTAKEKNKTDTIGFGIQYCFAELDLSQHAASDMARIRQQSLDYRREIISATTQNLSIQLGDLVVIEQHPFSAFNQSYQVISINLTINNEHGQYYSPKRNATTGGELQLIPTTCQYRPPIEQPPQVQFVAATIIGHEDGTPWLDENGRYHIHYDFDQSQAKTMIADVPINQAYTGPDSGIHLPLAANTKVVIGAINGQLTRPVIIGVLPNKLAPGPVTNDNASQSLIKPHAKQQLLFDDKPQQQQLKIENVNLDQSIIMNNTKGKARFTIDAKQGGMQNKIKHNIQHIVTGNLTSKIQTDQQISVKGDTQITVEKNNLSIKTQQQLNVETHKELTMRSQNGNINLKSDTTKLNLNNNIHIYSDNGTLTLSINNGKLNLKTKELTTQAKKGNITLKTPKATLTLTKKGTVTINAHTLTIKAKKFSTNAQQLQHGTT